LAKKSTLCLEYIIVHELVHLLERHHNKRFNSLMSKFMPLWEFHQKELNSLLDYSEWDY
ncbi:MAG: M48 family metallopeptidase, partial [Blastocatellia bacterium]|nr:M48 family metallopeptidase [Blastocatellia bacterium]